MESEMLCSLCAHKDICKDKDVYEETFRGCLLLVQNKRPNFGLELRCSNFMRPQTPVIYREESDTFKDYLARGLNGGS